MRKGIGQRPSDYRWTPEEMDRAGVPRDHAMRYWNDHEWALAHAHGGPVWPRPPQGRRSLEESPDWPLVVEIVERAEALKRRHRGLSYKTIAECHLEGVSPALLKKYRARYYQRQ